MQYYKPCKEHASPLHKTCKGLNHAKNMQGTNSSTRIMQGTCKGHGRTMQGNKNNSLCKYHASNKNNSPYKEHARNMQENVQIPCASQYTCMVTCKEHARNMQETSQEHLPQCMPCTAYS